MEFFLENAFGLYFFTFWFTLLAHTGLAFLFSSLFQSAASGRAAAIVWFIVFFIGAPILSLVVMGDPSSDFDTARPLISLLFSEVGFDYTFRQLVSAASGQTKLGMSWDERAESTLRIDEKFPDAYWGIEITWAMGALDFLVCVILAVYFEKVVPWCCNLAYGQRNHPLFCLDPSYWCSSKKRNKMVEGNIDMDSADAAVNEEARMVKERDYGDRKIAIEIRGLRKEFKGKGGGCCSGSSKFIAVKDIAYAIDEGSLFVLLGHNGAGKSTTFNMMTGVMPVDGGDAMVFGKSIRKQMGSLQRTMGVCPQHDVLWDQLTARQHLTMFAHLKGVAAADVAAEVHARLDDVLLLPNADQTAGSYSGGMRRRLSIAIALLGNPSVVYLDEPTTGMDPVTRSEVWNMIERAKVGRVIVLTTHSMEEADILGDRIAIMSHGKIQAIGSALALKREHGAGFRLNMLIGDPAMVNTAKNFVLTNAPAGRDPATGQATYAVLQSAVEGHLLFQLPRTDDNQQLVPFFQALEQSKAKLGVTDFSIGLSTLEEVFLNLSKKEFLSADTFGGDLGGKAAIVPVDAPDTHVITIELTVPEGMGPGDAVTVEAEGREIEVTLPGHAVSGEDISISVEVPSVKAAAPVASATKTVQLCIQVPDDGKPGGTITVEAEGQHLEIVLPDNTIAGMELTVEVEIPNTAAMKTAAPAAPEQKVDAAPAEAQAVQPAVPTEERVKREVTFGNQFSAMWNKSTAYQKKNPAACICVVLVAPAIMIILLGLQLGLYPANIQKAVCGTDAAGLAYTNQECYDRGVNISCLVNYADTPRDGTIGMTIGQISRMNTNGNKDGSFTNLELPDYGGIDVHAETQALAKDLGFQTHENYAQSVSSSNMTQLGEWHVNMLYTIWDNTCSAENRAEFDSSVQCIGLLRSEKTECQKQYRKLQKADTWVQDNKNAADGKAVAAGSRWASSSGFVALFDFCTPAKAKDDTTRRRLAFEQAMFTRPKRRLRQAAPRRLATVYKPTDEEIATVTRIRANRTACDKVKLVETLAYFESFDVAGNISAVKTTLSGPLGSVETGMFPDTLVGGVRSLSAARSAIIQEVSKKGGLLNPTLLMNATLLMGKPENYAGLEPKMYGAFMNMQAALTPLGPTAGFMMISMLGEVTASLDFLAPSGDMGISMELVCGVPTDDAKHAAMRGVLKAIMGGNLNLSVKGTDNLCAYSTNIDVMRRLGFKMTATEAAFRDSIFNAWGGVELITEKIFLANMARKYKWICACTGKAFEKLQLENLGKTETHKGFSHTMPTECPAKSAEGAAKAACSVAQSTYYKQHFYSAKVAGFMFHEEGSLPYGGKYNATIFYNNSGTGDDRNAEGPNNGNWHGLTWMMDSALVRKHTGRGIHVAAKTFPKTTKCNRDAWLAGELKKTDKVDLDCPLLVPQALSGSILDASNTLLPLFLMLQMLALTGTVVFEKEAKLRMIMKMMGLRMDVYWLVTYIFNYTQYWCTVMCIWIIGAIGGMKYVTTHDAGVLFLFFFLWGHVLLMFSFVLSNLFSNSVASTAVVTILWIIVVIPGTTVIGFLTRDVNTPEFIYPILQLFPPFTMLRGSLVLSAAGQANEAITMGNMHTYAGGTMGTCLLWFVWQFFALALLTWWLENAVVTGHGVKKSPCFCLSLSYWTGGGKTDGKVSDSSDAYQSLRSDMERIKDEPLPKSIHDPSADKPLHFRLQKDTKAEEDRVFNTPHSDPNAPAVRILKMHKLFSRGGDCGSKVVEKVAVKSLSLGINQRECFGLLGHNGAGKTTTINMLCGMFPQTSGGAHVGPYNLRTQMTSVYGDMSVCPQHNILWNPLTAREHLQFFGRLKGMFGKELKEAVALALKSVNLEKFANVAAGKFSGGMKRRLSVANAFIGDPKIVYLDEPSTGLDPASRRQLWDSISKAKTGKSIVLTTHSMEEADVLCDRVGIMASGELQCVDIASQLKYRFGAGYMFSMTLGRTEGVDEGKIAQIDAYVTGIFPSAKRLNNPIGGKFKYEVVREDVVLSEVFKKVEEDKEKMHITDWGITETTLEEVFLKLALLSHEDLTKPELMKRSLSDLARFGIGGKSMRVASSEAGESKSSGKEQAGSALSLAKDDTEEVVEV